VSNSFPSIALYKDRVSSKLNAPTDALLHLEWIHSSLSPFPRKSQKKHVCLSNIRQLFSALHQTAVTRLEAVITAASKRKDDKDPRS
jgi:hypothetical protein